MSTVYGVATSHLRTETDQTENVAQNQVSKEHECPSREFRFYIKENGKFNAGKRLPSLTSSCQVCILQRRV